MRPSAPKIILLLLALVWTTACGGRSLAGPPDDPGPGPPGPPGPGPPPPGPPVFELVPLTDLGTRQYLGLYPGGLYPDGSNVPPADHLAAGRARLSRIQPRNAAGEPDANGKFVLLSIGMSNASNEFCGALGVACDALTFVGQALVDPEVDRSALVLVNGAQSGITADEWDTPGSPAYDRIRDMALAPLGLSEAQVQVAWVKQAHKNPTVSLPLATADAIELERDMGEIVRAMATRYPNLELVFVSSRTYAGYATSPLNPEPYAYESGFAVKWLVESQIREARTGEVDPVAGDLDPDLVPWVGWGPYLWTSGAVPRSDGLVWLPQDVAPDGTHPAATGIEKVGELLLEFFSSSPVAGCWFLAEAAC
jgi:hypothetical protein